MQILGNNNLVWNNFIKIPSRKNFTLIGSCEREGPDERNSCAEQTNAQVMYSYRILTHDQMIDSRSNPSGLLLFF